MSRAAERRSQVGTGDRSEKIRTYNFPQGRVTDHRIKFTSHRLNEILEGDINELLQNIIMVLCLSLHAVDLVLAQAR